MTITTLQNKGSFRVRRSRVVALALVGQAAIASAALTAPTIDLTGRNADIYLSTMSGGVGTLTVSITPAPGSIVTQSPSPSFLQIAGADNVSDQSGVFTATIVANWDLKQDYAIANTGSGVELNASGSMAVNGSSGGSSGGSPSTGPFNHVKHNYQELYFSVSQDTSYAVTGTTWGGEYISIRDAGSNITYGGFNWGATYTAGSEPAPWSFSGTLAAGSYIISNRLIPLNNSGWDYSLTFQGAQVAAVPEPATVAMMLAGLALIGSAARRRAGFDTRDSRTRPTSQDPTL